MPLPPPTDAEVERLARRVARRLTKRARRYLAEHDNDHALLDPDDCVKFSRCLVQAFTPKK